MTLDATAHGKSEIEYNGSMSEAKVKDIVKILKDLGYFVSYSKKTFDLFTLRIAWEEKNQTPSPTPSGPDSAQSSNHATDDFNDVNS